MKEKIKNSLNNQLLQIGTNELKLYNDQDEIIAICLAGSTSLNLDNDNSDIDLRFCTLYSLILNPQLIGNYQNTFIHGWYVPIFQNWNNLIDKYRPTYGLGIANFGFIQQEDVLYINPKYKKIFNYGFENRMIFSFSALGLYYTNYHKEYLEIANGLKLPHRLIGVFIYYYSYYFKTPLDKNLIQHIKNNQTTNQDNQQIQRQLKELKEVFDHNNHSGSLKGMTVMNNLYNMISEV